MTYDEAKQLQPGTLVVFMLGPGQPYGYPAGTRLEVKLHHVNSRYVKCEFLTAAGRRVHRHVSPANLTQAKWDSMNHPIVRFQAGVSGARARAGVGRVVVGVVIKSQSVDRRSSPNSIIDRTFSSQR